MNSKSQIKEEEIKELKKGRSIFNGKINIYEINILKLNKELKKDIAINELLIEKENTNEKMNEKEQKKISKI